MSKLLDAMEYSSIKHKDQKRRYTGEAYIIHPISVMQILLDAGIQDENTLVAAVLHDVLEDTDSTLSEIKLKFGEEISIIVNYVSSFSQLNNIKGNRAYRKERDLIHYKLGPLESWIIKIADCLHNMKTIIKYDKSFAPLWLSEKYLLMWHFMNNTNDKIAHKLLDQFFKRYEEFVDK